MIQRIGNVHDHTGQLGHLLLLRQPEPCSPGDEPEVAIDVEPLVPPQPFLTASLRDLCLRELGHMWEDVRLDDHPLRIDDDALRRQCLPTLARSEERIQRHNRHAVDRETQKRRRPLGEPVEDEREMTTRPIDVVLQRADMIGFAGQRAIQ